MYKNITYVFLILIWVCVGYYISTDVRKLKVDNQLKADSLVSMSHEIATLRVKILNMEVVQDTRYAEQCRVDSIQDWYSQLLNIRTAPLLSEQ
jgi:hypothetical protein